MRSSRWLESCALAGALATVCDGGGAVGRACAAAAGTLVEAAPFVYFAALLGGFALGRPSVRNSHFEAFAWLAGCGCSRGPIPGALALPAVALCWLTFGPLVALLRCGAVLALALARPGLNRESNGCPPGSGNASGADPLGVLETLAASAFLAALALPFAERLAHAIPAAAPLLGLALGMLAPCATAGVAIAAAFAHRAPLLAAGILVTTGMFSLTPTRPLAPQPPSGTRPERAARVATAGFALALGSVALLRPGGLVNPRLFVPIAAGSALAFASVRGARTRSVVPALGPALIFGVVALPPSPPPPLAAATELADATAGERLDFTGLARTTDGRTTLARFALTCCRLDAEAVAVRLDRPFPIADGHWAAARGTLVRSPSGELVLRAASVRPIAPPSDPFMYR